jgi:uncharacterized protein YgbK (DUF1537 family)
MLLGCIADDFTGGTDLANNLVRGGMRSLQTIGVPAAPLADDVDAVVVALKTRTVPVADAVAQSLAALDWLKDQGCRQFFFKYASTFDSTPAGNIGPVTDALMDALGCDFTISCPAFPENGRTVFRGHLFVGDVLLNESGMRNHPLTPMTDANLVRVLQAQTRRRVGHVGYTDVARGADAVRARFGELKAAGAGIAIVDAISDADLATLGRAAADLPLVAAGSGLAIGLSRNFAAAGLLRAAGTASDLPPVPGWRAIVSGSCSEATNAQVAHFLRSGGRACALDPLALAAGKPEAARALEWARPLLPRGPVLVYSTAAPEAVKTIQQQLGADDAGALIERSLAEVARGLVAGGVRQLIVAGGETSGAAVQALGVRSLRIGPQIDPGVPWTLTDGPAPVLLALKSGNFGGVDFFTRAFRQLEACQLEA